MAGWLVLWIVPGLTARLTCERGQQLPAFAAVPALEDARRFDPGTHSSVADGERRYLRHLAGPVGVVGEALAGKRPCFAQVAAAPDGRAVPLARGGRVDRAHGAVIDGVIHGPALAERPAQLPALPVAVAFEQEEPLAS